MDAVNGHPGGGRAWPRGIVGAYAVFAALVLGFVSFAFTQRVDLVSPDYYQREMAHQQHIDSVRRTRALPAGAGWSLARSGGDWVLALGGDWAPAAVAGTIHLYRPDDALLDRRYPIALDDQRRQAVPAADLAAGAWRAKIRWRAGGQAYYSELPLRAD